MVVRVIDFLKEKDILAPRKKAWTVEEFKVFAVLPVDSAAKSESSFRFCREQSH